MLCLANVRYTALTTGQGLAENKGGKGLKLTIERKQLYRRRRLKERTERISDTQNPQPHLKLEHKLELTINEIKKHTHTQVNFS